MGNISVNQVYSKYCSVCKAVIKEVCKVLKHITLLPIGNTLCL